RATVIRKQPREVMIDSPAVRASFDDDSHRLVREGDVLDVRGRFIRQQFIGLVNRKLLDIQGERLAQVLSRRPLAACCMSLAHFDSAGASLLSPFDLSDSTFGFSDSSFGLSDSLGNTKGVSLFFSANSLVVIRAFFCSSLMIST